MTTLTPYFDSAFARRIDFSLSRLFDILVSAVLIILAAPLMLIVALAITLESPGSVLFCQDRVGRYGKTFRILKFRSMRQHDQSGFIKQAHSDDPRITLVGRFIRKTSIDELPQLFNVLFGDMALVGPRPHARSHDDYYAEQINGYRIRHRVLPGMTGLAQVRGQRGETPTVEIMAERIASDIEYVQNKSFLNDLLILAATPMVIIEKSPAKRKLVAADALAS